MNQDIAYSSLADCYDVFMHDVDYDAWAGYLGKWLADRKRVLDCACGTGAITVRLKSLGYDVTGLDVSADMLRVAQRKTFDQGLKMTYIQQDMRKIQLHHLQDAVVCACDGVNYLSNKKDVKKYFDAVYQILKPGGIFLFDISSCYKLKHVLDGTTFGEDLIDFAYLCRNLHDPQSGLTEMELTVFVRREDMYECFRERHIQRAYKEKELMQLLAECGFSDIAAYDAFTEDPVKEDSQRIQFVAYKK